MKNRIINIIKWTSVFVITFCIVFLTMILVTSGYFEGAILKRGLTIKKIENISYDNGRTFANVELYDLIINKELWCIAAEEGEVPSFDDEWQKVIDNQCNVNINNEDKYIYVRDDKKIGEKIEISKYISGIAKIEVKSAIENEIKLIKDEEKILEIELKTVGNPDKTLEYRSEDEEIVKIENGILKGINDGVTGVTISDKYGNIENLSVQVTSLITEPTINNSKPFIKNMQYTEEEAKILDEYLFYKIDEAGYKTRAGVVAAARFLSMQLEYRIPYFIENGRITHFNHQRPYCDGEGRYFHRGLYLSKDKFEFIEKSVSGPAMWGAYIMEWSEDNGVIRNGLDCSGFVCWCLINGGFDQLGDIGGGLSEGLPTISDYGVSQRINMDLLESGKVKAGDPIGYDGHIGIIVGVDEENIYVADTLYHSKGLWVTKYTYKGLVNSHFTHIYDYTEVYGGKDGNYTNMW